MITKKKKQKNPIIFRFVILILLGISFATVAYANTTYDLETTANLSLGMQEGVIITNVSSYDSTDQSSFKVDRYVGTLLTNTIRLLTASSEVTLEVEIKNTGNTKHRLDGIFYDSSGSQEIGTYDNPNVVPEIVSESGKMNIGDIINPSETKRVLVKYKFVGDDFSGTNPGLLNGMINIKFSRLYNITYELNGGTQAEGQPEYYAEGDNITLLSPTKDRFYFDGWNTRADGTGTSYTNGELVNNLSSTNGAEITLYAQWKTNYIYFQVPPDWDGNSVSVYLFNSSTNNTWPGYSATSIDASKNIFGYELSENDKQNYTSIIINSATGARQTVDLDYNNNLLGKVFVPKLYNSSTDIRVFFSGSASWTPYIYLWNISSGSNNHAWPGLLMSGKISGSGYSEIITKSQYNKMIFNKGSGGVGNQTDDMNVPTYQDLTYKIARNGNSQSHEQTRFYYDGEWNEYDNWINSGYSVWYSGDYTKFQSAQSALGY